MLVVPLKNRLVEAEARSILLVAWKLCGIRAVRLLTRVMLAIPRLFCVLISVSFASLAFADGPVLTLKPDHADGIYALNENVVWTVDITSGDRTSMTAMPYTVKKDGLTDVAKGTIDLSAGPATITATRAEPGALLAQVYSPTAPHGLAIAFGGAVYDPDHIGLAVPEPADFGAFWQGKLKELAAVPLNPVVEKVDVSSVKNSAGIDYYKVTLDNIRGTHVHGQLARPTKGDKFPAILMLQFAGVYGLDKGQVIAQAMPGWLALNISAHDLPIDESDDYYKNLKAGALKITSTSAAKTGRLPTFCACFSAVCRRKNTWNPGRIGMVRRWLSPEHRRVACSRLSRRAYARR